MCCRNYHTDEARCMYCWKSKDYMLCDSVLFMSRQAEHTMSDTSIVQPMQKRLLPYSSPHLTYCLSQTRSLELCLVTLMVPLSCHNSISRCTLWLSQFKSVWQHPGRWILQTGTRWRLNEGSAAPGGPWPPALQYLRDANDTWDKELPFFNSFTTMQPIPRHTHMLESLNNECKHLLAFHNRCCKTAWTWL